MFAPRIGFGTRYWHWILASESGAWLANRRVVKFYDATKPSTRLTGDQLKKWPLFDCLSSGLTCFLWPIRQFSTCQLWLPIRTAVAAALCLHRRSLNLASYTPFDSFLLSPLEIPRLLEFTANMGMTHPGEHASLPNQTSHLEQRVNESQTACGGNRYAVCCDCGMINIRRIRFWQPEPHGTL